MNIKFNGVNIPSDPELENQINDRLSFSKPSPDHSTFSRFRSRLSKAAMEQINSEILRQFEAKGLSINEGVAVDARLVELASRPMSNDDLKEKRAHRNSEEGQKDKHGNPLKFSRDLESDWTIKNEEPHFGLKEHTAVDAKHGFILATIHSPASVHDTNFLQYCTIFSRHTNKPIKIVYADKGYAGLPNRNFLSDNKIADGIMRKDSTTAKFTLLNMFGEHLLRNLTGQAEREIERNKKIFTPLNHIWNSFNQGPRYATSSNDILESVIFTTKPSGHGLQPS